MQKQAKVEEFDQKQYIADLKNEEMVLSDDGMDKNKDQIISNVVELDNIEQDVDSATTVMNWAMIYKDTELFNKYKKICQDRGGCQEDPEGKG